MSVPIPHSSTRGLPQNCVLPAGQLSGRLRVARLSLTRRAGDRRGVYQLGSRAADTGLPPPPRRVTDAGERAGEVSNPRRRSCVRARVSRLDRASASARTHWRLFVRAGARRLDRASAGAFTRSDRNGPLTGSGRERTAGAPAPMPAAYRSAVRHPRLYSPVTDRG